MAFSSALTSVVGGCPGLQFRSRLKAYVRFEALKELQKSRFSCYKLCTEASILGDEARRKVWDSSAKPALRSEMPELTFDEFVILMEQTD